jgi:transcription antitermination factor NusG
MSLDEAAACQNPHLWYALRVRTRHEKSVGAALRSKGYDEFVPLYKTRRRWAQRIAEIELPLFPGYVFCRFGTAQPGARIVTTPGILGIVEFGGRPVPVDEGEIAAVHRVLELGIAAEPWKYTPSGQRVRIEHGALAGLEGIFVEAKKNHRLLLSLALLQRTVAIQIDASSVVRVKPARGVIQPTTIMATS